MQQAIPQTSAERLASAIGADTAAANMNSAAHSERSLANLDGIASDIGRILLQVRLRAVTNFETA